MVSTASAPPQPKSALHSASMSATAAACCSADATASAWRRVSHACACDNSAQQSTAEQPL
jgi:hypothetical protein